MKPHPFSTLALPDGIVIGGPYPNTIIAWPNGNSRRATKTEYDLFQLLETTHGELTKLHEVMRPALIAARFHYFHDMAEHGEDGSATPELRLLAVFDLLGMTWCADPSTVMHHDEWAGNAQWKPNT